jgi:hypothetical protein
LKRALPSHGMLMSSDSVQFGMWRQITVPNRFRIGIPADAQYSVQDNEKMFVIRLASKPITEILIGLFILPFLKDATDPMEVVAAELVSFAHEIVPGVTKVKDICPVEQSVSNSRAMQVLIELPRYQWWLARGILFDEQRFYLVHWNGPKRLLKDVVLPILESFEPLLPEDSI